MKVNDGLVKYSLFMLSLVCVLPVSFGETSHAKTQDSNEHQLLVQGLRSRGLYQLADRHCIDMLGREGIGLKLQADLIVEQILTRTAWTMSAGESTDEDWSRAVFPGTELLLTAPEHPRRFLVQLQMALVDAARAKSIRQQARFGIRSSDGVSAAIAFQENCRRNLEKLQREIVQAIPRALQRPPNGDELSPEHLQSLSANVNYQLASCLTEIAGMYEPNDRLNRIDALNMVLERVEQVRRQTGVTSGLNQACELLRIEALQLSGNRAAAWRDLEKTDSRKLAPDNLQRFWQILLNQPVDITSTIRIEKELSIIESRPDNDPETEIAVLQYLVRQSKTGGSATGLELVRTWADRIHSRFGTAWGRIANRLLLEAAGASVVQAESVPDTNMAIDLAIRAAENALSENRTGEAIEAFRTASSKLEVTAASDGQIRQAFRLRVRIAELLAGENDFPVAAMELRTISDRFVSHDLAAAVHLRAVWYAQQLVRPNLPESAELYLGLLQNQIERWSRSSAADQARLWRAGQFAANQQWRLAIEDCLAVDPAGDLASAAVNEVVRIMTTWFASMDREIAFPEGMRYVQPVTEFADRACATGVDSSINAGWKLRSEFCGLGLRFGFLDVEQIRSMLDGLLAQDKKLDVLVSDSGIAVLAACEVLGSGNAGKLGELLQQLRRPDGYSPGELEFLRMTGDADRTSQTVDLLRVQLDCANQLAGKLPPGDQQNFVRLSAAQLYLALREYGSAVAILEPLAKALPNHLDVQLATARGMSGTGDRQNDAINAWRFLATRLAPQSEHWFEARHEIARLTLLSGNPGDARQMLEFLNAVPPGWKDSIWASRLDLLLKKCRDAGNQ